MRHNVRVFAAIASLSFSCAPEAQPPQDPNAHYLAARQAEIERNHDEQRKANEKRAALAVHNREVHNDAVEDAKARESARKEADAQRLEADCAKDRDQRREYEAKAAELRAKRAELQAEAEAFVETKCKHVWVPEYSRVLCDDGSSVARVCTQKTGEHKEIKCPPGGPSGVSVTGISVTLSPADQTAITMADRNAERNRVCNDVRP